MIPVIALVGRHNVGKSTIFNRLTKTQAALVADFPGLTRDRQYGEACFADKAFLVVDTGGIGVDDRAIDALMSKQSELALNEADVIFFVVDARTGLTAIDQNVASHLRKLNKPLILVVNKIDGLDERMVTLDFQALGFADIYAISATHGRGVTTLLSDVTANFTSSAIEEADHGIKIAFIGRPNVGKSTLINRILGEERVVVYDQPGTTRDSINISFVLDNENYTLIDTAGIRRRARIDAKIETFSVIKTLQAIKATHVCVMVLDAREGLTDQDMHLLSLIVTAGKALVIAVNKWDGLTLDHKEHVRQTLARRLSFVDFAKIRYISAKHGSGVGILFKDIRQAYASAIQLLSTPKLTRLLNDFTATHAPPLVKGRRIKLRYAHAGGHNPPIIVIHGNQLPALPDHYRRYLVKAFTEHLGLIGTPLRLEFKSGANPFQDQKNKLTDKQIRHKKRLMKWVKKKHR